MKRTISVLAIAFFGAVGTREGHGIEDVADRPGDQHLVAPAGERGGRRFDFGDVDCSHGVCAGRMRRAGQASGKHDGEGCANDALQQGKLTACPFRRAGPVMGHLYALLSNATQQGRAGIPDKL